MGAELRRTTDRRRRKGRRRDAHREVGSFAQKWNAERAVERVNGVRGVANDLEVPRLASTATWRSPGQPRTRCDGTAWCPQTASPQKWKRLDQAHRPRRSRLRAPRRGRAVRYLSGVRGVSTLVTVKAVTPRAKPKNIKADIERIFQRQAALDAKQVSVEVSGDVVTLRGQVRSWAERREAERVAWAAPCEDLHRAGAAATAGRDLHGAADERAVDSLAKPA